LGNDALGTEASQDFAWTCWTNVTNWDDPPARFELDGSFAAGSRGTTHLPGQAPLRWLIRDVDPRNGATIEPQPDGAVLSFEWRLEVISRERTFLSQRVLLQGENAATLRAQVEATFVVGAIGAAASRTQESPMDVINYWLQRHT
jgi:hypothetical protein